MLRVECQRPALRADVAFALNGGAAKSMSPKSTFREVLGSAIQSVLHLERWRGPDPKLHAFSVVVNREETKPRFQRDLILHRGTRHLKFAELQSELKTLNELIEEFQRLAGFKSAWCATVAEDLK